MNLLIRDATPDDAPGILAVLNPIIDSVEYSAMDTALTEDGKASVGLVPGGKYLKGPQRGDVAGAAPFRR